MSEHSKNEAPASGISDKVFKWVGGLFVVLVLAELGYHKHPHFDFEGWFGFYPLFGLIAYGAFAAIAGAFSRVLVKGEDYYDK